jgi:iron(III) transport system substrate-binding protein
MDYTAAIRGAQTMMHRRFLKAAGVYGLLCAGLSAVLAGVPVTATAQTRTVAAIANYSGADRQAMLEDGARREGVVLIYTTGTQIQPLIDRFKQKYPFLRVELARAGSTDVASKVVEEYSARVYLADAFELAAHGLLVPRDLGILQPFTSPEAAHYEASAIEPRRHWISVREGYTGIGINTQKIAAPDAPKTYLDLLDPKWKGRMAISSLSTTAAHWVGTMVIAHGVDYVRKLGQQSIRPYRITARAVANLMISGEVVLSPTTYLSHVEASRAQGAPLAWFAPGPVPVTDTSVAIAARAPHPHAAMLFADFLLSREAQLLYRDLGYMSSRTDMPAADGWKLDKLFLTNRPNYMADFEQWMRLVQEIFLRGQTRG